MELTVAASSPPAAEWNVCRFGGAPRPPHTPNGAVSATVPLPKLAHAIPSASTRQR